MKAKPYVGVEQRRKSSTKEVLKGLLAQEEEASAEHLHKRLVIEQEDGANGWASER